jgi:predicted outer membrane protein
MRFFLATLAAVATLTLAPAAFAGGVDGTDQALLGLNGVVTSPPGS